MNTRFLKRFFNILVAIAILALSPTTFAQGRESTDSPVPGESVESWRVVDVEVRGLLRTERFVLIRELEFGLGEVATRAEIEESVQRLRNLGLFRTAEWTLETHPKIPGAHILVVEVDERWTLMPFGNIRFGGDLFSLTAGVFDVNTLGRYIQTGAQYSRLGDTNSVLVWLYDPRFLGERIFAGVDFAWTNRIRGLYDDRSGDLEGAYLRFRRQLRFFGTKEVERWFSLGATLTIQWDEFSYELLGQSLIETNEENFGGVPDATRSISLAASARLGRIDAFSYEYEGVRFTQAFAHSDPIWGANIRYTEAGSSVVAFKRLPFRINLAGRFGVGMTTADHVEKLNFVGGFGTLRGFIDSRFRGKYVWYSNAEFRVASFDYPWFVLQHIGFLDAAGTSDRPSDIWEADGASTGVGLRLIIPKIYSFVARIDYALSIVGDGRSSISFGAQQFF